MIFSSSTSKKICQIVFGSATFSNVAARVTYPRRLYNPVSSSVNAAARSDDVRRCRSAATSRMRSRPGVSSWAAVTQSSAPRRMALRKSDSSNQGTTATVAASGTARRADIIAMPNSTAAPNATTTTSGAAESSAGRGAPPRGLSSAGTAGTSSTALTSRSSTRSSSATPSEPWSMIATRSLGAARSGAIMRRMGMR